MRIRLLVEGYPTNDGRVILPGAVVWNGDPIPVVEYGPGYDSTLVGSVVHVHREPDGSITGETDVVGTVTCSLDHVGVGVSALDVYVVKDARLSGAVLTGEGSWPWPDFPQRGKAPNVCPECGQGKCGNCDGSAWDDETDDFTACTCEWHLDEPPC